MNPNQETDYERINGLDNGQCCAIGMFEGGGGEIHKCNHVFVLFEIPQYGCVPKLSGAYEQGQRSRKIKEVIKRDKGGFTIKVDEKLHKTVKVTKEETEPKKGKPGTKMVVENKISTYRANESFKQTLEQLLPLKVKRLLGNLDEEKLSSLELSPFTRSLKIKARGQLTTFAVGKVSYGGQTTYIRREPDGPVYLVSNRMIQAVDFRAPRFMERRLVEFPKNDAKRILVQLHGSGEGLELIKKEEGKKSFWVDNLDPDSSNPLLANWIDRLFRITATEYLGNELAPTTKKLAHLELHFDQDNEDQLELVVDETEKKKAYYAKSKFTGVWVKLNIGDSESVFNDLPALFNR